MMRRIFIAALSAGVTALALSACVKSVPAPTQAGVCWHVVWKNGQPQFNKLADHQPNIETCAASLEGMRLRFLGLGGQANEIVGAYQGNFLFLQPEGVFISQSLTGTRYLALVRTGDGRLAMPGAVSQ